MGDLSDVGSFLGGIPGDIGTGLGDIGSGLGNIGSSLGNLFGGAGGGSLLAPGTVGADASSLVSGSPSGMALLGTTSAGAGDAASAFGAAPGIGAGLGAAAAPSIDPSMLGGIGGASAASGVADTTAPASWDGGSVNWTSNIPGSPMAGQAIPASNFSGVTTGGVSPANLSTGGSSWLNSLLGSNPGLKTLAQMGLLGGTLALEDRPAAGSHALSTLSNQQAAIAKNQGALGLAEQQGLLPAGAEQLVQNQLQAQQAAIRQKYAQLGMSGSTAESQDLQAANAQAMAQLFAVGQQMSSQSYSNMNNATGYESSLLRELMQANMTQDTEMGNALAQFVAGLAK